MKKKAIRMQERGWKKVKFASQCRMCVICEEPWCDDHKMHYGDCDCIGPTEDGVEYIEIYGVLYARRIK